MNDIFMQTEGGFIKYRFSFAFLVLIICSILFFLPGCASTFLVSKDCYSAFLDSDDEKLNRILCETGDLSKIVEGTDVKGSKKNDLRKAFCERRSGEEVRKIYISMTKQDQEGLKLSFEKHGYDINYKPVEASGAGRITGLKENLLCPAQGSGY